MYIILLSVQVCHSSEEPVLPILLNLTANLEHCKKSLSAYLMEKRLVFPRLFYMPDDGLLTLLSNSESVQFVAPYLRYIYTSGYYIMVIYMCIRGCYTCTCICTLVVLL